MYPFVKKGRVLAVKVIFLDFDGVLNSEAYVRNCGRSGVVIDPACLLLVKKLVEATGAKIVLTTSWREHWDADSALCDETGREINAIFGREGLEIFDKTQVVSRRREEEIEVFDFPEIEVNEKTFPEIETSNVSELSI